MNSWIVFLLVAVPIVLGLMWILADESIVRVPSGSLGLLLVRGRATNTALEPGVHFVPRLRRHMVEMYPSVEGSFRAGGTGESDEERMDYVGPPVFVRLGDRAAGMASYTVRLRLDPAQLKEVHNRYGSLGYWGAVRDITSRVVRSSLNDPQVGIDTLYGQDRDELEQRLTERISEVLGERGFLVSYFAIDHVDLGRAEDAIQSAVRARLELAREEAEFDMRVQRARRDADISRELDGVDIDAAMRYRETDAWIDLASQMARNTGLLPDAPSRGKSTPPAAPTPAGDQSDDAGTAIDGDSE
jgi:regulator of protease activity HflC (stomatin/prohibitin superfamily)